MSPKKWCIGIVLLAIAIACGIGMFNIYRGDINVDKVMSFNSKAKRVDTPTTINKIDKQLNYYNTIGYNEERNSLGNSFTKVNGDAIANMAYFVYNEYVQNGFIYSQNPYRKKFISDESKAQSSCDAADCSSYVKDVLDRLDLLPPTAESKNDADMFYNSHRWYRLTNEDLKGTGWKYIDTLEPNAINSKDICKPGDIAVCGGHIQIYYRDNLYYSWEANKDIPVTPVDKDGFKTDETFPSKITYSMPCELRAHSSDVTAEGAKWRIYRFGPFSDDYTPKPPEQPTSEPPEPDTSDITMPELPKEVPAENITIPFGSSGLIKLHKDPSITDSSQIYKRVTYKEIVKAYNDKWKNNFKEGKLSNYMATEDDDSVPTIDSDGRVHAAFGWYPIMDWNNTSLGVVPTSSDWVAGTKIDVKLIGRSNAPNAAQNKYAGQVYYLWTSLHDTKAHTYISKDARNWLIQTGFAFKGGDKKHIYYTKPNSKEDNYTVAYNSTIPSDSDMQAFSNGLVELIDGRISDFEFDDYFYITEIIVYK